MKYNDLVFVKHGQMLGKFIFHRQDKKTIIVEKIISNIYVYSNHNNLYQVHENDVVLASKNVIVEYFNIIFDELEQKIKKIYNESQQMQYEFSIEQQIEVIRNEILNTQKNMQKLDLSNLEHNEKMKNLIKAVSEKYKAIKHLEYKSRKFYKENSKPLEIDIERIKADIDMNKNLLNDILKYV